MGLGVLRRESRTGGGCRRDGKRERKRETTRGMRRALTVKTRTDSRDAEQMGPHSKNGLAGFSAPANRSKPHERGGG